MATTVPVDAPVVATCPACGYPTLEASLCAVCTTLAAGLPNAGLVS